jgi:hypothetical protein
MLAALINPSPTEGLKSRSEVGLSVLTLPEASCRVNPVQ